MRQWRHLADLVAFFQQAARSRRIMCPAIHIILDGPPLSGGLRYYVNSVSLRFVHRDDMEAEGYAEYLL
jgi:peptide methionine sulfoxide reductase MsrB